MQKIQKLSEKKIEKRMKKRKKKREKRIEKERKRKSEDETKDDYEESKGLVRCSLSESEEKVLFTKLLSFVPSFPHLLSDLVFDFYQFYPSFCPESAISLESIVSQCVYFMSSPCSPFVFVSPSHFHGFYDSNLFCVSLTHCWLCAPFHLFVSCVFYIPSISSSYILFSNSFIKSIHLLLSLPSPFSSHHSSSLECVHSCLDFNSYGPSTTWVSFESFCESFYVKIVSSSFLPDNEVLGNKSYAIHASRMQEKIFDPRDWIGLHQSSFKGMYTLYDLFDAFNRSFSFHVDYGDSRTNPFKEGGNDRGDPRHVSNILHNLSIEELFEAYVIRMKARGVNIHMEEYNGAFIMFI